ncbi:RTA1 like protein-domain-containing protein [Aspergillus multicolor]|uniref:RTA1 domain-containing protein n=1 Tax=Aspergillus multicolor TaxID=41759 RepID=UPI003CCDE875
MLFIFLLISAAAVLAVPAPAPAPAPTPAPTAPPLATIAARDDYAPDLTLDLPTISIKPFTLSLDLPSSTFSLSLDLPTNTCTPTVTPDSNGYVPPGNCNALYSYYPSFAAAVAFSVLFGVLLIAHFVQATIYKATFVWVVLLGAAWECTGYVSRAVSTKNQQDTTVLTVTQMFILTAPILVNAFDYMVLARMINFFIPERQIGIFKPSLLAVVFVILDIGAFVIQLIGGGMATPTADAATMKKGLDIYMGGIGIQQFFILCFTFIAIQYHRRMLRLSREGRLAGLKAQWRMLLYALYASLLFITIRIIFRLVEFSQGNDENNTISTHEWYMYAFDAAPMWCAIAVWNVVHPGRVIKGPDAKMPPSPLRKIFACGRGGCCACCRRRKNHEMQKIPDEDQEHGHDRLVGDEMVPLNVRAASPLPYR